MLIRVEEPSRGLSIVVVFLLVFSGFFLFGAARGHSEGMNIYSTYDLSPVAVDGNFGTQEWENSTVTDMRQVWKNTLEVFLYVKNNGTHLFILYDAVGDTTKSSQDNAGVSFDGDHNGALTQHGDHEFTIKGDVDSQCSGFNSPKCHFIYERSLNRWIPSDDMNDTLPYQSGLAAAIGFNSSVNSPTPHRIYEFSIPMMLLGQPTKTVALGDVVGFYAGRHSSPSYGVWDAATAKTAIWPDNNLVPNDYCDLFLGEPVDSVLEPDFQTRPARPGQSAIYPLRIRNTGTMPASYDLEGMSAKSWSIYFFDAFMNPLLDNGGISGLVDVGPVSPGSYVNIRVGVNVPAGASLGETDMEQVTAFSWVNASQNSTALLRTGVPYITPWFDDLEQGSEGWYVYPRPVTDWEFGTVDPSFTPGPQVAHTGSGPNVWATKLSSNYSKLSNSYLYSPFVEIPDYVTESDLYFWHWYDIIGNQEDGAWVEMSSGGGPFELIAPSGGYPDSRFGVEPAYAQSSGGWLQADFNISSAIGTMVCFRFRFWDFSNVFGAIPTQDKVAPGWYIDDFQVTTTGLPSGVAVNPNYAYSSVLGGQEASYEIFVRNTGSVPDIIDIDVDSSEGWQVGLYDPFWNPLPDTESPPDGFPDTNRLSPGEETLVRVNITVPLSAQPGVTDQTTFLATSSNNLSVSASATIETLVPYSIPFFDDMENGTDDWMPSELWHQVRNQTGTEPPWNITYSGNWSWWYGQDSTGNYDTGSRTAGNLTSPPINLVDTLGAELSFRYWYETEQTMERDQRWLLFKVGNKPWQEPGDPGAIQLDLRGERTWLEWRLNLSAYIGNIIRVRFHFDTMDSLNNAFQGWYIDDFLIEETIPKNHPPTISISRPHGGESFSSASNQGVNWTVSDDSDRPEDMMLWLNYSVSGGRPWVPIAGAQGISAADGLLWKIPWENSSGVLLNATVRDSGGLSVWVHSKSFEIDGRAPRVLDWEPKGVALTNDPVIVSFSETMNQSSLQNCLSVKRMKDWTTVEGKTLIYENKTIVFVPTHGLVNGARYQANVSSVARDDSNPGLHLAGNFSWTFQVNVSLNTPPRGIITQPSPGVVWTGGSDHSVQFSVLDSQDSSDFLRVWLNYSSTGSLPWDPIPNAQGILGNKTSIVWTLPSIDSASVVINLTVMDSGGLLNWTVSAAFEIDSTPPQVIEHGPNGTGVSTSTPVWVVFSESMDRPTAEAAFKVSKVHTGTEVVGTYSWVGNRLYFHPSTELSIGTEYAGTVYSLAKDDSIPGNRLVERFDWNFSTEVGDVTPPTVLSTFPLPNSTDVPVDVKSISIQFNESIYMPSLRASILIEPSFDADFIWTDDVFVISPRKKLPYETEFRIVLNASGTKDLAGNPLDGDGDGIGGDDYTLTFVTESQPEQTINYGTLLWLSVPVLIFLLLLILLFLLKGRVPSEEEEIKEPEREPEEEVQEEVSEEEEAEFQRI